MTTRRRFRPAWLLLLALGCLTGSVTPGADSPGVPGGPATGPGTLPAKPVAKCDCGAVTGAKRYTREVARYRLPDATLLDTDGAEVAVAAALDREGPVVLQFVFTTCPTICGPLSGTLASARKLLGEEMAGARLVSISIDPEHDRPQQLRQYAKDLNAGPEWQFYTGRREDIAAVQKAFDAYQVNKMEHLPLTFLRPKRGAAWVRLTGLLGAGDLAAEYRGVIKP